MANTRLERRADGSAFATTALGPGPSFCGMGRVWEGQRGEGRGWNGGRKRLNKREEVLGGQDPPKRLKSKPGG